MIIHSTCLHTKIVTVDITGRYLFLYVVFTLCIYQHVHSDSTEKNQAAQQNKQLNKLEEHNEKQHKIDTSNIYLSPKANEFLSYDKCMQRMKCPVSRNTEEEIEEYKEMTMSERRSALRKKPKPRFDANIKKRLNKYKRSFETKQSSTNSTDRPTIKTDL
ncbi:unnamed protein product [Rotaria sordida]|uniref:Uncharacterized protein n=1 Tax=Rotaria sordida TaxID=392033 RepID=A0A813S9K2_9BILA|nr:unnamed protein product [Rotaria sordida]CAF0791451.1 unnamed protein product [Rotaria sordida]CAF0821847.1 unnamed protein product [Rotaria sordida]